MIPTLSPLERQRVLERELLKRRAREGNILAFTKFTWMDYQVNWHHKRLAQFLNRFIQRKALRCMVFLPPRHGKSELVSRRLPALIHGLYPDEEILSATYSGDLAADMTVDVQRIMDTPEYQELFPYSRITPEGKLSSFARNKTGHELMPVDREGKLFVPRGSYRSQGVGGAFSGRGGNWIFVDDPIKNREDADSKTVRENVWKFYTSTLRTRQEGNASILVTMTRWHESDLAGRLLDQAKQDPKADQWEVLSLPAIRDTFDDPLDPRLIGEPLWPSKFDAKWLESQRATNERDWSALYQQSPVSEGGNIFKAKEFKYYTVRPTRFDVLIQSWDFSVKKTEDGSFCVGQVWGRLGADKFLLAQKRQRVGFPGQVQMLLTLSHEWPSAHKKVIENKANGPAVKDTLHNQVPGLCEANPCGDKIARANAVAPDVQSGNVWLPDPTIAPWINEFVHEVTAFPNGATDDQVDAMTQALDELRKSHRIHTPLTGHGGTIFQN